MRFDKDIWLETCTEYQAPTRIPNLAHFSSNARLFVSAWLEILQDDRTPTSRVLRSLALPDLLGELRRALDLHARAGGPDYRLSALCRLAGSKIASVLVLGGVGGRLLGMAEATRLKTLCDQMTLLLNADKANRQKVEHQIATALSIDRGSDVGAFLRNHLERLVVATHARLRSLGRYLDAICETLFDRLCGAQIDMEEFEASVRPVIEEALAFVLERGMSRETLAELPIKNLRGDNLATEGLERRMNRISNALTAVASQRYVVVLPLSGPPLQVRGEFFPPGVVLLTGQDWSNRVAAFGNLPGYPSLLTIQALEIDCAEYVASFVSGEDELPKDVFAARDLALRAAQLSLNAIYLHADRTPELENSCAVQAYDLRTGQGPVHAAVLDITRVSRANITISLPFLRPVPPDWSDALAWYFIGNTAEKNEAAIVNLWTSGELLVIGSAGLGDRNIDRMLEGVGVTAGVRLFGREQLYCSRAASEYAVRYGQGTIGVPANFDGLTERDQLAWWLRFCEQRDAGDLATLFDRFPQLALEAVRTKKLFGPEARQIYAWHKARIRDNLGWIYGCRNDIVHEGRSQVPGSWTARRLVRGYVHQTLRQTLALHARGAIETPAEAFALMQEIDRTIESLLAANDTYEALEQTVLM